MVVIGIMAVVVMPRLDLISGFDQSGFRDELQSSLEYARKAAVAARRYVCVATSGSAVSGTVVTFSIDTREPDAPAAPFGASGACVSGGTYTAPLPLPSSGQRGAGPNSIAAPSGVGVTMSTPMTFDALGRPVNTISLIALPDVSFTVTGIATPLTVTAETGLVR
jgi:MSHA pilin protein MshC